MSENAKDKRARAVQLALRIQIAATNEHATPGRIGAWTEELLRLAGSHGALQVARCNRPMTPRDEKREETIEAKIAAILAEINPAIKVDFGGDPRGYTVKLHFPEIDGRKPYNTWGGAETGWGI